MQIIPIKAFSDNYIWAIHRPNSNHICVVDPGDSKPVLAYLEANNLILESILVTHYHADHIGGVKALKQFSHCQVMTSVHDQLNFSDIELNQGDTISLFDGIYQFQVLHLPGHTLGHIAYFEPKQKVLFCGDTLFSAGCGRMFEGTPQQFYQSLQKLAILPAETQVYCTHEYTLANLAFAEFVEPDNAELQSYIKSAKQLRQKKLATLPSTIERELQINPFLRCDKTSVQEMAQRANQQPLEQPWQIFATIRQLKDNY